MAVQFHPYAVVLAISALTTLTASILITRRDVPGSTDLGGVLLNLFIWSGSYALIWSLVDLNDKLLWLKIMHIGIISAPTLFLFFTIRITNQRNSLTTQKVLVLFLEPAMFLLCVWLRIDLLYKRIWLEDHGTFTVLQLERASGYWINIIYSHAIILMGLMILFRSAQKATPYFRRQYLVIFLAAIIPVLTNIYSQSNHVRLNDLDLTPFTFAIASIISMYALYQRKFMDLVPVARERLIESMSDGVLVLDTRGRIVDVNPAMNNFLEETSETLIGKNVSEVLHTWNHNANPILDGVETRTELKMPHRPNHYLDLRITALYDDQQKLSGRLIVFRDVTDRKEVEKDLRQANDRLQTQLVEIGLLQSQLREQAIRDALTNVFNRRYLEETLERELARAERDQYPLCVIMMDLDFFKVVNDTYGHEAGDVVLKTLTNTITHHSRHGDLVCRYGGEEFVLVMPNISLEVASQRAEDLHRRIGALQISYGIYTLTTTVSMGIAIYPDHGATKDDLLRAADQAMYVAKHTGRNRVVIYQETTLSTD